MTAETTPLLTSWTVRKICIIMEVKESQCIPCTCIVVLNKNVNKRYHIRYYYEAVRYLDSNQQGLIT